MIRPDAASRKPTGDIVSEANRNESAAPALKKHGTRRCHA
jgi:hypothetical protein